MRERIIGLSVTLNDVKHPSESAILSSLGRGDWSPLRDGHPPQRWEDPAVYISLGQCESCGGPFIVEADTRGSDPKTNTIYFGTAFRKEVDEESGLNLLHAAYQNLLLLGGRVSTTPEKHSLPLGRAARSQ